MATLATIALECAKELGRVNPDATQIIDLEAEIKSEIGKTIQQYNRRPWALSETRQLTLTTQAGEVWYSTASTLNAYGAQDPDRTVGADPLDTGDITSSQGAVNVLILNSNTAFSVPVRDILNIRYMRENASSLTDEVRPKAYHYFEKLQEGAQLGGTPLYYTRYAEQIGIYPVPDRAYALTFSAEVKPVIPTGDLDRSVWFEEAPELIQAAAAARIYLKYLRDPEGAQRMQPIIEANERDLHGEYVRKSRTGKIKAHD